MEKYWTSNKTINGLRHFVLVNETKEKGNISFLMVSVLDSEINLKTTYEELINSGNWHKGWINLSKHQSITEEYVNDKAINKGKGIDEIFINEDSLFNIFSTGLKYFLNASSSFNSSTVKSAGSWIV